MLFDIRQPVPLMIVAALHIAVLMLFQSGLHRPQVSPPEIRPVAGYLVRPQIEPVPQASKALPEPPPTPLPRIAEPAPPEIAEVPPKTAEAPPKIAEAPPPKIAEAPKPKVKKPAPKPPRRKPSADPVTQPVRAEPAVPAIAATPEAAAPPPAAPPASEVAAAPPTPAAPAAPAPVAAPRFDAAYLNNPAPAYPPLSRRMGEEGKVVLRVQVSASGKATDVQLHSSSGSARLDDAAREAVRGWRFVPAMRAEQAIAAWVLVPVSFRLDG